jgi:hypothetical protein
MTNPIPFVTTLKDLHAMKGVTTMGEAPLLDAKDAKELPNYGTADLVALPADFAKDAKDAKELPDWVVTIDLYDYVTLWNTESGNTYKLKSEGAAGGRADGYGAGWNYQGKLYFSHNAQHAKGESEKGVFEIMKDSINLDKASINVQCNGALCDQKGVVPADVGVKLEKVGNSAKTNKNDGANCLNAPSPWPHECKPPKIDVPPVDGKCPKGSTMHKKPKH